MPTSSAHAQYVVTETTDDGTGATAGTLSNAILQANATGGTISFNLNGGATTLTLTGSMYGISAAAPVTIIGGGTTINGNNFQAFTVNSGNVDFQNLTIANGLAQGQAGGDGNGGGGGGAGMGGAIYVDPNAGAIGIQNVTFTANVAQGGAGGSGDGVSANGGNGGGYNGNAGPNTAPAGTGGGTGAVGAGDGTAGGYGGGGGGGSTGAVVAAPGNNGGGAGGLSGQGGTGGAGLGGALFVGNGNTTTIRGGTDFSGDNVASGGAGGGPAGSAGSAAGGDIYVGIASNLIFDNSTTNITVSGSIANNGFMTIQGAAAGTVIFTGTVTTDTSSNPAANITISSGTLQIGNGGTTGSIVGDVVNGGTLTFNRSDSASSPYVFAGNISDDGGSAGKVSLIGPGAVLLSGNNTYTGGTAVTSGTLSITNGDAIGTGLLELGPGTTFGLHGSFTLNNNITVAGVSNFDVATGNIAVAAGVISDVIAPPPFGAVQKVGAGTLVLDGINTYSGGTVISAGILQVTNGSSIGSGRVYMDGGTFQADGFNDLTFTNNFTVNTPGGTIDNNLTILTLSGDITNGSATPGLLTFTGGSGFGGTTVLSGNNTYSGGSAVLATTVQVTSVNSLGTGAITLDWGTIQTNGTDVTLNNNITLANTISLGGFAGGFLDANGGRLTIAGNINGPGQLETLDSTATNSAVVLLGTNTYGGGTFICVCSTLQLGDATHTASILGGVTNEGFFDIVNANTSGITSITNQFGGVTTFSGSTGAGTMTIDNVTGGSVEFRGTSSAANATINNVVGTGTTFFNNSTAGNATINNLSGGFGAAVTEFNNFSRGGTATINNAGFGFVVFNDRTTLENAKIVNNDDGFVLFNSQSSAGTALASITNNDFGQVHFLDRSTAGGVTIHNNGSGVLDFANRSTAGDATIINSSSIGMAFLNQSTAGNAFITTENNSFTYFFDRSDGGTARFETEAGSIVDFSGSRGPNGDRRINAGSVGGAGTYFIGAGNTLVAGGNNRSTEVSGVIADFDPCGCGPAGPGSLEKVGTGNLILSGINTYTGATTVNGGILSVNGDITSSSGVTVNAGGTLGGNGIVGDTTINGGTLAPGNSIGLLTVQGSLVFTAAASYLVEVTPANADRTNVTGTATLGGATVNAHFATGSYVARQYIILNATGGLGGSTFNALANTDLPANFSSNLSYDANNVYLNLTLNFIPPPNGGLSVNQQNVGNAIVGFFNSNGGIPLAFGGLTPAGLSQVSGETATGTQQATFDAMNLFLGLITDPFVAGRGDGFGGSAGAAGFADESAMAYAAKRQGTARDAFAKFPTKAAVANNNEIDRRWSVWGAAFGGSSTTDGNSALGSNSATARAFGFAAGADYRISPATLAGFALAGGGTGFSVNGFGSGRSDLFQAGTFLRHNAGPAYVTAAAAYGWQDVTTDRTVTAAGVDRLRAQFNANAWSGRVEGGYRYVTSWIGATPYAAGQFTTYQLPAYAEQVVSGAGTFALNYAARDVTASRSELGIRTDKSYAMAERDADAARPRRLGA